MDQLLPESEQLLADLASNSPILRQAAAVKLAQMTTSNEQIVTALEKVAAAGGTPYDGSAQAAEAAGQALQARVHRKILIKLGHPVASQDPELIYWESRLRQAENDWQDAKGDLPNLPRQSQLYVRIC